MSVSSKAVARFFGALSIAMAALLFGALAVSDVQPAQASVVTDRLKQVKKVYPDGKKIKPVVIDFFNEYGPDYEGIYAWQELGSCNGLVGYVTQRVFHNPFGAFPADHPSWKRLGRAKTSSYSAMKKLVKKAKKGDVIVVGNKSDESEGNHYMIFDGKGSGGFYVYEANWGGNNKVYDHHFWSYSTVKVKGRGAKYLKIYHSKNYSKINKKKAAKLLKVGKKITVDDVVYKVKSNKLNKMTVKYIKKLDKSAKIAKTIGVNGNEEFIAYNTKKPKFFDQQLYTVIK